MPDNEQDVKDEVIKTLNTFYPDMKDVTIYSERCIDPDQHGDDEDDRGGFEFTGYTRSHQVSVEQGGIRIILLHSVHILAAMVYMTWQSWSRPSAIVIVQAKVWEETITGDVYYSIDVAWPLSATRTGPKFIMPPSSPGGN